MLVADLVELFHARFDPARFAGTPGDGASEAAPPCVERLEAALDAIPAPRRRPHLPGLPDADRRDGAHELLPRSPGDRLQARPDGDPRPAAAPAAARDLGVRPAGRGRAPPRRRHRPGRAALERPPRGLPHRGARPDEGADGEERGHRADRRQGRVRRQAPAGEPDELRAEVVRVLPGVHLRAARPDRQPRRAPTAGERRRSCTRPTPWSTTATTPTSSSPPTRARRRSATSPTRSPSSTASGSATPSRPVAAPGTTTRRWASPPAARGRACAATPACSARTPRPIRSPRSASATCPATCSATGCCGRGSCGSSPRSTTATSSSTPTRTRRSPSTSASGCSSCRGRAGRTTTRRCISAGGGVYPRTLKSIELSPQARAALGAPDGPMTPNELVSIVLRAPVDLLWNGGIGTYVKASTESNADVGDRANDGVRVNGGELRCRMVGEGGNLGLTQLGRVEYALGGGLVYTDAIDNSAGVDCSDHEVNIKILLDGVVDAGELTVEAAQRAAGVDDRRGRRARARQQPRPDAGAGDRQAPGAADGQRARPLHRRAGDRGLDGPRPRVPPDGQADRRAPGGRAGSAGAGVRRAHRLHQERQRRRGAAVRPARRCRSSRPTCWPTSRPRCASATPTPSASTRCGGRSSPRGSSTRWSTCRASPSTTA